MTPEQINNFRTVLVQIIGPYALLIPDEEVVKLKDNFQARINTKEAGIAEAEEKQDRNWCSKCGKAKTSRHVCI